MKTIRSLVCAMVFLAAAATAFAADDAARSQKEAEQLAILRGDAALGDKALACKRLAIWGSKEAVPELKKLLGSADLNSWARIALEAIPGEEADAALVSALDALQGRLLIGTINSIGVRRAASGVQPLVARLNNQNLDVAAAAAVALGHIGNAESGKALRAALKTAPELVRSAVAEGCILCAERALAEKRNTDAEMIYHEVRRASVPKQRILEATRGAILARGEPALEDLMATLRSPDRDMYRIGLSTAREFPGKKVDQALASELDRAKPQLAALLISAMADRPETVVLPAVLKAAEKGDKQVRLAAIGALGRVGNATCLAPLLNVALESDEDLQKSAKATLADLPGDTVDADIVKRLDKPQEKMHALLIQLVGARRIAAMPALLKAMADSNKEVRSAALVSLGETVPPDQLSVLVAAVVAPKHAEDEPIAQQALKAASIRMPDREACGKELSAAIGRAPAATKIVLLEILGAVGGTNALEAMATAAKSSDAQLQDTSTKLLGEWMTIDAAPVLLDLVKSIPGDKFQNRALKGYIRIARQFIMEDPERIEMCRKAFAAARNAGERKLVLEVLRRPQNQSLATLKLAVETANKDAELKDDATQAAVVIAASSKLGDKQPDIVEQLEKLELPKLDLEITKAEYGAGGTQKDVADVIRQSADGRQWIRLSPGNYSEAFGGDPAPGTAKKLTIHYKINGKAAETSLAENSLIVLTMPK